MKGRVYAKPAARRAFRFSIAVGRCGQMLKSHYWMPNAIATSVSLDRRDRARSTRRLFVCPRKPRPLGAWSYPARSLKDAAWPLAVR